MIFKAVIFDLDGTLLNTLDDLADVANRVLTAHGLPIHPVTSYRYFVGEGLTKLLERIVPDDKRTIEFMARLTDDFKADYSHNWDKKSRMYDGVDTMLNGLQAKGIQMAILSNKPHEFTQVCVHKLLPDWKFYPLSGARDTIARKPDPAGAHEIARLLHLQPAEILFLGDTATDMQTACKASMYPVGALWGFRSADELAAHGAQQLIHSPRQLLDLL